jgi:hypothetical protein
MTDFALVDPPETLAHEKFNAMLGEIVHHLFKEHVETAEQSEGNALKAFEFVVLIDWDLQRFRFEERTVFTRFLRENDDASLAKFVDDNPSHLIILIMKESRFVRLSVYDGPDLAWIYFQVLRAREAGHFDNATMN